MLNFSGRLKALETGSLIPPISRTRFNRCALLDGCKRIFARLAVFATEVGYAGKVIDKTRLVPDSLIYPVPATLPMVFLGRCSFVKMSRTTLLFISWDHSAPPLSGCIIGLGSVAIDRMPTIWGQRPEAPTAPAVISHVSLQGHRELMSMTYPLLAVVQMFSAMTCLQPAHVVVELRSEW